MFLSERLACQQQSFSQIGIRKSRFSTSLRWCSRLGVLKLVSQCGGFLQWKGNLEGQNWWIQKSYRKRSLCSLSPVPVGGQQKTFWISWFVVFLDYGSYQLSFTLKMELYLLVVICITRWGNGDTSGSEPEIYTSWGVMIVLTDNNAIGAIRPVGIQALQKMELREHQLVQTNQNKFSRSFCQIWYEIYVSKLYCGIFCVCLHFSGWRVMLSYCYHGRWAVDV